MEPGGGVIVSIDPTCYVFSILGCDFLLISFLIAEVNLALCLFLPVHSGGQRPGRGGGRDRA